jgi:hypothetical protein
LQCKCREIGKKLSKGGGPDLMRHVGDGRENRFDEREEGVSRKDLHLQRLGAQQHHFVRSYFTGETRDEVGMTEWEQQAA